MLLLEGDLGSGKTVLVQGLARALGIDAREVQSPTFTLLRMHEGTRGRLLHFDLYRLEPGQVEGEGFEELLAGPGVKAVEWSERLPFPVPAALRLRLEPGEGPEQRTVREIVAEVAVPARERKAEAMEIRKVGVLGCGLMGSGIAEVCIKSGFATVVREVDDVWLAKGTARLRGSLDKAVEKGKLEAAAREAALGRLHATTDLGDLADCDLVVEAIVENLEEKRRTFGALAGIVKPEAIFASNTSSLTVTQLAAVSGRPERTIGLHFFNPVPVMKLVEVVRTILSSEEAIADAMAFCRALGKEPIACRDNSGFIVNRLLVPYLLDAIRALEEGVGSVEDIDKGMQLGCGYPMGPFTLLDFVGLDTTYFIANIMFEEYRERRFAPPPLLKQMVQAGRLGRKSGRGFYEYGR